MWDLEHSDFGNTASRSDSANTSARNVNSHVAVVPLQLRNGIR